MPSEWCPPSLRNRVRHGPVHAPDAHPRRDAQHRPDGSRRIACSRSVPKPPQILRHVPLGNSISTRSGCDAGEAGAARASCGAVFIGTWICTGSNAGVLRSRAVSTHRSRSLPRRYSRRQVKIWFAFTPWRRVMTGTELPDCSVSRTICSFSCTDHCLRLRTCLPPDPAPALCSAEVSPCPPRGHLLSCPSICKWAHHPRPEPRRLCGLGYTVTVRRRAKCY